MAVRSKALSVAEAADYLRIHPVTISRLVEMGKMPGAFKVGGSWRIDLEELKRYILEPSERMGTMLANAPIVPAAAEVQVNAHLFR